MFIRRLFLHRHYSSPHSSLTPLTAAAAAALDHRRRRYHRRRCRRRRRRRRFSPRRSSLRYRDSLLLQLTLRKSVSGRQRLQGGFSFSLSGRQRLQGGFNFSLTIEGLFLMNSLSNIFSYLTLDAEDDTEQISNLVAAKQESDAIKQDKAKKETSKNGKILQENPITDSEEYRAPLVWIDLEMTGLNVEVDRILEIACVITDGRLTKSVEGPDLVIKQSKECLSNMGEWCQEHHAASGLTKKVLQSTITEKEAEKQVMEFVRKHIGGSHSPLLAGNSVYVDLMFLKKYMPGLAGIFPHVLVDVSSITALCSRWFPKEKRRAPKKEKNHRAMDDIKESIKELKYYKENIFKLPNKSKN